MRRQRLPKSILRGQGGNTKSPRSGLRKIFLHKVSLKSNQCFFLEMLFDIHHCIMACIGLAKCPARGCRPVNCLGASSCGQWQIFWRVRKYFTTINIATKSAKKIACWNWQIFDSENFESKMKQPLFLSDWEQNLGGHDSSISSRSPKVFSKVWRLNDYWHDMILSWWWCWSWWQFFKGKHPSCCIILGERWPTMPEAYLVFLKGLW